jgi:hypothetical protein
MKKSATAARLLPKASTAGILIEHLTTIAITAATFPKLHQYELPTPSRFSPINVPCSAIHPPTTPYAQQLH